jgi:hypothetical protein
MHQTISANFVTFPKIREAGAGNASKKDNAQYKTPLRKKH